MARIKVNKLLKNEQKIAFATFPLVKHHWKSIFRFKFVKLTTTQTSS